MKDGLSETKNWCNLSHHTLRHTLLQTRPFVIKWWFNRVEEDESGLTFQEWTPDVDTSFFEVH